MEKHTLCRDSVRGRKNRNGFEESRECPSGGNDWRDILQDKREALPDFWPKRSLVLTERR